MRRRFVEAILQQEGAIAAHQAIQAMEEETAQIGGRRQLADVLDIALPAHQRSGSQSAVLGAVIGVVDPGPQALVQLFQRERLLAVQVVQELLAHGTEVALDFSAAFGLIGRRVHDENADGGGDARQLRAAIDLGVIHVETHGQAAGGDGLAQAVQAGIQALAGIELGVRDEPAGIVEGGMQEGLHLAAAGALDVGAIEHVGLPDLVAVFGFELLVRRRGEQLPFGEAALFEEAIQGGGGDRRRVFWPDDRASSRNRVVPVRCGFSRLSRSIRSASCGVMVRDWPRSWRGCGARASKPPLAVTERPIQQRIDRNRSALGMRECRKWRAAISSARRVSSPRGSGSSTSGRDQSVTEQGDFFGFGIHREDLLSQKHKAEGVAGSMQKLCVGPQAGGAAGRSAATTPVRSEKRRPAQQVEAQIGKQEAVGGDPADGLQHVQGPADEVRRCRRSGQRRQRRA